MTLTRFNGKLYWQSKNSAKGWGKQISNFHILDSRLNSKRFIAHTSYGEIEYQPFEESRDAIVKFARQFGLAVSPVYETVDNYHTTIPYYEIYLVNPRDKKNLKERDEFASSIRTGRPVTKERFLAISTDRKYNPYKSITIDLTSALKSIHKPLIRGLDRLLMTEDSFLEIPKCQPIRITRN
jgi:hypothetical protein